MNAPPSLAFARTCVTTPLRAAVDSLDPQIRHLAGYHFGWWDADGTPASAPCGKALRPALALVSASASGSPAEVGIPGAVAVELVHNFSLLHDDLMDGDRERRHRETVWSAFSPADAILAGDALLALANSVLLDDGGPYACAAIRLLTTATRRLIAGQADDLAFERRGDVSIDEVVAMEGAKTGALLGCSTSIGALLAGADRPVIWALQRFGEELGLAFQLVDDLLGIWGRPEVTGKPVLADVRSKKKSAPVVAALTAGGPSAERLAALYAMPQWESDEDIELAAKLIEDAGGRDWATVEASRRLDRALGALESVTLDADAQRDLVELAEFVTARDL